VVECVLCLSHCHFSCIYLCRCLYCTASHYLYVSRWLHSCLPCPCPRLRLFLSKSVWSVSASREISRVTDVQNMLVELSVMIELLAGSIYVRMRRMYVTIQTSFHPLISPAHGCVLILANLRIVIPLEHIE
jgi:hypothetical protein